MEVRLEVIAADMVMDSTHPVLQVEDVPMKRFEVRSLGTVFNVVPFARQGAQVTFPSVRSHNGRSLNGRFQELLERLSRSIFNHSSTASLQLRFPSRHVAVIDFNRHQHEAFAALAAPSLPFFTTSKKRFVNLNVFSKLMPFLARFHRQLHFALEEPSRFLVYTKLTSQLARTHSLFSRRQKMNHGKGGGQWKFDFVEQCVRRRRFIESTGSTTAVVASPPLHRMAVAATAAHESVAPFLVRQIRFARFFAAKLLHEFNDCPCLCHGHPGLMFQNKTLTSYPIYDVRTNPLIRLCYFFFLMLIRMNIDDLWRQS